MSVLDQIYGSSVADHEKVAGAELTADDLSNISAADYVQALGDDDFEKVASVPGIEDVDLSQISALDLIQGMIELEEGPEKVATGLEGVDLSTVPASELAEYLEEVELQKVAHAETALVEAMIDDGDFDRADMAGRIMARAQVDELQKLASAEDDLPDFIDLDDLNGAELQELLDSGEYELEKDASAMGGMKRFAEGARDVLTAKRARGGVDTFKKGRRFAARGKENTGRRIGERFSHQGRRLKRKGARQFARGVAETGAAYGTPVAAAGATAYGLRRKKKNRKG